MKKDKSIYRVTVTCAKSDDLSEYHVLALDAGKAISKLRRHIVLEEGDFVSEAKLIGDLDYH
jgi:hypothetical protein